jgi:hypothetical protein
MTEYKAIDDLRPTGYPGLAVSPAVMFSFKKTGSN